MPERVVKIPGVGDVAFPESMSDDEVSTAAAKLYQEKLFQEPGAPAQEFSRQFWRNLAQGALDTVGGTAQAVGAAFAPGGPESRELGTAMLGDIKEGAGKTIEAYKGGRPGKAFGYGLATLASPLGGMEVARQIEGMASGDPTTQGAASGRLIGSLGSGAALGALTGGARSIPASRRIPLTPFERTRNPLYGTAEAFSEKATFGRPQWEQFREKQQRYLAQRGEEVQSKISPSRMSDERLGAKVSSEATQAAEARGQELSKLYRVIDERIGTARVDMRGFKETAKAKLYPLMASAEHVATSELKQAIADLYTAVTGPDSASFEVAQHVRSNLLAAERKFKEALPDRGMAVLRTLESSVTKAMQETAQKQGVATEWQTANRSWAKYKRDFHRGGLLSKVTSGVEQERLPVERVPDAWAQASNLDRSRAQRYLGKETTQALKGNLVGRWLREAVTGELTSEAVPDIALRTGGAAPVSTLKHSGRQLMSRLEKSGKKLLEPSELRELITLADEFDRMSTRGRQEAALAGQALNIGGPVAATRELMAGNVGGAMAFYPIPQFLSFLESHLATKPVMRTRLVNAVKGLAGGAALAPAAGGATR